MKFNSMLLGAAAFSLSAAMLHGATAAQQGRITLVERDAAPGATASADLSIARRSVGGRPDEEAHVFGETIQVGSAVTEVIHVAFHATTPITKIEATNDFRVVGGSCRENQTYNNGDTCSVAVEFKGMGPGHRAGQLKFSTSDAEQTDVVGLQGNTLGAAIAFTPAVITTLSQTVVNGTPVLYDPGDLTVDQGDNLYITDQYVGQTTNSGKLYMIDGSEKLTTIAGGGANKITKSTEGNPLYGTQTFLQDPLGVAVDPFLNTYVVEAGNGLGVIDEVNSLNVQPMAGLGASQDIYCTTPCPALSAALEIPSYIKTDVAGNIFFTDSDGFYTIPATTTQARKLQYFPNSWTDGEFIGLPFAVDNQEDIYVQRAGLDNICQVEGYQLADDFQWAVAGSGLCGYAANNVRSQNAEIGQFQGGLAMDAAGDLYFADTVNNILRRVDNYNGLIHTVGGNFALGANYTGDGGPATSATLNNPIGIAVDSNGVIYTSSFVAGATIPPGVYVKKAKTGTDGDEAKPEPNACVTNCGPAPIAVIRKIGPNGVLNYPATLVGMNAPTQTISLTNVGNDSLVVSNAYLGGADAADFVANGTLSNCTWGTANPMASGHSCQLGYYCSPKAAGARTATVFLVDNTATFQHQVTLNCYGVAAPVTPTVVVNSPASSAAFPYLQSVPITVTVGNAIPGPTPPTGTVTLTVKDLTSSTTYTTIGPLALVPSKVSSSSTVSYIIPGNSTLKAGSYSIVAAYSGDTLDAAASSAADPYSVTPLVPAITWATPAEALQGSVLGATQLNATATFAAATVPGTLTYTLPPSTTAICAVAVTTAALKCTPATTVSLNTLGEIPIKVVFTPTDAADYSSATDTVDIEVYSVAPAVKKSSTSLVSHKNPVAEGDAVKLQATVEPAPGGTVPTGTVTLKEGGKTLITVNLVSGAANIPLNGLRPGTHILTAEYSGDKAHEGSASEPLKQLVVTIGGVRLEERLP